MTALAASPRPPRTVVVGGGIAGLVCAIELERAGHEVVVLEREAVVGGRARSRIVDGFIIDRGFQVYFTAYPTLGAYLDHAALALCAFPPAARIALGGQSSLVGDAVRDPRLLLETLRSKHASVADKLRLLALRRFVGTLSVDECFAPRFSGVRTRDFLRGRGFSEEIVARFFAPFYGGILLDRSLGASAALLLFTFKMLAEGDAALPATGIGAIAAQLASRLRGGVRTGAEVVEITADVTGEGGGGRRASGVRLASGESLRAEHVVLAADAPASARLARGAGVRLAVPEGALACTTLYLAARAAPLPGRALWLNAARDATVSHAVTVSEVAPGYAARADPGERHLLAASVVGDDAALDDETLVRRALADLGAMRASATPLPPTRVVAIERVAYAQFPQPPHFRERRPPIATSLRSLWMASEVLHSSSLEGAARGGRDAARAIAAADAAGPSVSSNPPPPL